MRVLDREEKMLIAELLQFGRPKDWMLLLRSCLVSTSIFGNLTLANLTPRRLLYVLVARNDSVEALTSSSLAGIWQKVIESE